MNQSLAVYTHFNGSLINKYCKNHHQIRSYVTPSTDLIYEEVDLSAVVVVIDYGMLYESCYTQTNFSIAKSFNTVLDGYFEYVKTLTSLSNRIMVIGLITNVFSISFFDNYLKDGYISQIDSFAKRIRSHLDQTLKGIYVSYQSKTYRDETVHKMSSTLGATYDPVLFKEVGIAIDSFSNAFQAGCKAIIFDLDNTLWKGIIGEGFQNTSLGDPKLDDAGYYYLRHYVRLAYETGIFTAICSKNDINTLQQELDKSGLNDFLNYFTVIKANWSDKSKNITQIANELNIGLDACVFIDDNPREVANIISKLPQVQVLNAADGPWRTLEHLIESQYVKRHLVLDDDITRNKTMSLRIKDNNYKEKQSNANNFEHEAEFYECDISLSATQMRVEQLSLKTNQFNLSTRRLTWNYIDSLIHNNLKIIVYGGKDKYGDLGIIGYVLYEITEDSILVLDWIMSCRAFGLKLEYKALKIISERHNINSFKVQYDKNDRNKIVLPFFKNLEGFEIEIVKSEVM